MDKLIYNILSWFHNNASDIFYTYATKLAIRFAKWVDKKYNVLVKIKIYYEEGFDLFVEIEETKETIEARKNNWKGHPYYGYWINIILEDKKYMKCLESHIVWSNFSEELKKEIEEKEKKESAQLYSQVEEMNENN